MASWQPPTPELISRVLQLAARPAEFAYFFDRLENPEWVPALVERGAFSTPPEPIRDEAAQSIQFPAWPLSAYLVRVADLLAPEPLEAAIRASIDTTTNMRVQRDLLAAIAALPPDRAALFVPDINRWIAETPSSILEFLMTPLCSVVRLLESTEAVAADRMLRALLYVEATDSAYGRDVRTRVSDYYYREALALVPSFARYAPQRALEMLVSTLHHALQASHTRGEQRTTQSGWVQDYSWMWHGDFDDDEFRMDDPRRELTDTLRETLPVVLEVTNDLPTIIRTLEEHRWLIFERLVLDFLADRREGVGRDEVAARLLDRDFLDDSQLEREFEELVSKRANELTDAEQAAFLAMIDAGPSDEPESMTADQLGYWRYVRLAAAEAILREDYARDLEDLHGRFGTLERHPRVLTGWRGSVSPVEGSTLLEMTEQELVAFLRTWEPADEDSFQSPNREGLASTLQEAVRTAPEHFAPMARSFIEAPAQYQVVYLRGLESAMQAGFQPDWIPLLALAAVVVRDETTTTEQQKAVLWVLHEGWGTDRRFPIEARDAIWALLRPLTDSADPTAENELAYVHPEPDPVSMAINHVRSSAIRDAIRYGLWVAESLGTRGWEVLPELRDVLDAHLTDDTLSVRAVYGEYLRQLDYLDPNWVAANAETLFGTRDDATRLQRAAWETYLLANSPTRELYGLFEQQYDRAIEQANEASPFNWGHLGDPVVNLGQHLIRLYWWGVFGLEDGPLPRLFQRMDAEKRRELLTSIGQVLRAATDVSDEIQERARLLWEWRRDEVREGRGDPIEFRSFIWWFASGLFDDRWAINTLAEALRLGNEPDGLFLEEMLKRLVEAAEVDAAEVLAALDQVIDYDRWGMISRSDAEARAILRRGLDAQGEARAAALAIIDKLARRGQIGFSDLAQR